MLLKKSPLKHHQQVAMEHQEKVKHLLILMMLPAKDETSVDSHNVLDVISVAVVMEEDKIIVIIVDAQVKVVAIKVVDSADKLVPSCLKVFN